MQWSVDPRILVALRPYGWLLPALLWIIGARIVAKSLNILFAAYLTVIPTINTRAAVIRPPEITAVLEPMMYLAERNLMGVKREQLNPADEKASQDSHLATGSNFREEDLQPCSAPVTLRATLVADLAEWSMAVVLNNNTREPGIFTINTGSNQIAEDVVLVAIRSREIVVRRRDHFERCLGEGESGTPSPVTAGPSPMVPGGEPSGADTGGVTKLSETDYRVDRSELDRVLGNLNEVATQARMVPSFKNGKPDGFKVFAVVPGSIFSKIGLQNGDVIQKVNGFEMNSVDRALELYQRLSTATTISVQLTRRGTTLSYNYNVR